MIPHVPVLLLQLAILLKAGGLQTVDDHYTLGLNVSNGYLKCGHVD